MEAQLRAEIGLMRDGAGARNFKASIPKLPAFGEQKDDMDVYLQRYEWFPTSQERDEGDWVALYSQGKDYRSTLVMPLGKANNYEN